MLVENEFIAKIDPQHALRKERGFLNMRLPAPASLFLERIGQIEQDGRLLVVLHASSSHWIPLEGLGFLNEIPA